MGFWDKLAKAGGTVIEAVQKQAEQQQREKENAEYMASRVDDDRELVKRFQSSSGVKKYGYAAELEKRGYLERNSEGKFQRTNKTL
ncbi:hypothetical protein V3851_25305 [Paenibacillus sp. M1]|uniref:Uncharacterized protein n=1 Tax=Paenibacillus haidiansis TaxID=1574488 RepID=A0ABU7W041_9BACL